MDNAVALNNDCDSFLALNEYRAWQSANGYREALSLPRMPVGLNRIVDTTVLPALKRIGINESFAVALIQIAMPAWESIGKTGDKIRFLDPEALTMVAEVDQGLLRQAQKTYDTYFRPSLSSPAEFFEMVEQRMHPRNLFDLLDEISTSWIILPRAFSYLEKKHCRYLPLYLDMLTRSTNELCLDKWIRITIEFIANYTIKFADKTLPIEGVINFVVSGYEAMFWHTLRSPPVGFEDNRIFEHYLNWMSHSGALAAPVSEMISEVIGRMISGIHKVFPSGNAFQNKIKDPQDISCFKIALRHGCLGIVTTAKYFWFGPLLIRGESSKATDYTPTLTKLRTLFKRIEIDYQTETRRTRYFIRDFLHQFEAAYKSIRFPIESMDELSSRGLQLLVAQILLMVKKLRGSIFFS